MHPFTYRRAATLAEAVESAARPGTAVLAGGTTLVDLMRGGVLAPEHVVDIGRVPDLDHIDTGTDLRLGALARMADVAAHPVVRTSFPAVAESLRVAASQQIRGMATIGGNLLQRTRCPYFRDGTSPCNKRAPGSGCSALDGPNRDHAVLGGSAACVATYPGDLGTALVALDARVELLSAAGAREIRFADLHREPGDTPAVETTLRPGELIIAVTVPGGRLAESSAYVKVADRARYAFAVASAAVALDITDGVVTAARVGLGSVATTPRRSAAAEAELVGRPFTAAAAQAAGEAAFADAVPRRDNRVKAALGPRVVARACLLAAGEVAR